MELNPLLRGTELTDSCCLLFFVFWMDMFRHLGHLIMLSLRLIPNLWVLLCRKFMVTQFGITLTVLLQ